MAKKFYVVWAGRETGIFTTWADAKKQVDHFPQAKYKSFSGKEEARAAYSAGWGGRVPTTTRRRLPKSTNVAVNQAKQHPDQQIDVTIYCDGGCDPNPGKAASGLALYRKGQLSELWYGLYNPNGTNNTAELNALHQSLVMAKDVIDQALSVQIFCDSQYAINCVTLWAFSWKKKGWKRKTAGDIKNLSLIQTTHALYESIRTEVVVSHIKAHAGIEGNELADRMSIFGIDRRDPSFCQYTEVLDVQQILRFRTG